MANTLGKKQWNMNYSREKRASLSDSEREAINLRRKEEYAQKVEKKRQAKSLLK